MDEGIAVIIAAVMAILGIFYASRQNRILLRKQHTFQVIDKLSSWKELDEHIDFAAQLLKTGKVPRMCDEGTADACSKIDFMLNYYEVLACAIMSGDVDEQLFYRMERGRLCRTYLQFIPYIEENRGERSASDGALLWENLEFITYRWLKAAHDRYETMLDWFMLRPVIPAYRFQREEIAAFLCGEREKL